MKAPSEISRQRHAIGPIEYLVLFAIVLVPMYGTFSSENYFTLQDTAKVTSTLTSSEYTTNFFPIGRTTTYFVLIYVFYALAKSYSRLVQPSAACITAFLYVGYALVTSLWSSDPSLSFNRSIRLIETVFVAVYLVEMLEPSRLRRLLVWAALVNVTLDFVAGLAFPRYGLGQLQGDYSNAWRGVLVHKNYLGSLVACTALIGLDSWVRRTTDRKIALAVLFGSLALLILSRSATSIAAAVASFAIYGFGIATVSCRNPLDRMLFVLGGFLMVLASSLAVFYADELLSLIGRNADFTGRSPIWAAAIRVIGEDPIWGQGHGWWSIASPLRSYVYSLLGFSPPHAHNTFLDMWLQLGIFGLGLGLLFFIDTGRATARLLLSSTSMEGPLWGAITMNTLIKSLTETQFLDAAGGSLFWLTLALAAMRRQEALDARLARAVSPRSRNMQLAV